MKKLSLICVATLLGMSLAGCGNNSSHKATSSSRASSSKVVKHHKKNSSKKQSSSSSSVASQQAVSQSTTQQAGNAQGQQASSTPSNGQLPPSTDLHDFVNRYGESPAAYLSDHYGMSQSQALNSVPDNMKSSGELQYQEGVRQGYIQP